jgi:hypothetical protein
MFVLTLATDYEGEMLIGVYSTRELAEAASQQFQIDTEHELEAYEHFVIRDIEVDGPAQYHF